MNARIVFLFIGFVSGATAQSILIRVDSLLNDRKYNSAFELLHKHPESNTNPELTLKKSEIAMNYFVQSMMHKMFAFKDLEPEEYLDEIRGSEGSFPMYLFPIDSILENLSKRYPKQGRIRKTLGDYYYDVDSKYGSNWLLTPVEMNNRAKEHYLAADKLMSLDYLALHNLGVTFLKAKDLDKGLVYLRRSHKLKPDSPSTNYNIAYALLSKNQPKQALTYAQTAFNGYDDPYLKADAAQMVGIAAEHDNKTPEAIRYYETAHELNPKNYGYVARLFNLYLKTGSQAKVDSLAIVLFGYGPHNPNVLKDIIDYFYDHNRQTDVPRVLALLLKEFPSDHEARGSIFLQLSSILNQLGQSQNALATLDSSHANFRMCFKPDHNVFGVIENARKQLTNPK